MQNIYKKGRLGYPDMPDGRFFQCIYGVGDTAAVALDQNGQAWSIGKNCCGMLGTDECCTISRCTWAKVCCDWCYSSMNVCDGKIVLVRNDGKPVTWGGINVMTDCSYPPQVMNDCLFSKLQVSPEGDYFVGWLQDGTAVDFCYEISCCTGATPTAIACSYTWCKFALGHNSHFGIRDNGRLYGWGRTTCGVLGNGAAGDGTCIFTTPQAACGGTSFKDVVVWDSHWEGPVGAEASAVGLGGSTVYKWGVVCHDPDDYGCICKTCCVCYSLANGITKIASDFNAGLDIDGYAYTWGFGSNGGRLGDGQCYSVLAYKYLHFKTEVCGGNRFKELFPIHDGYVGIMCDGYAVAWGGTWLGDGTSSPRCQPVAVCCDYKFKVISCQQVCSGRGWYGITEDYKLYSTGCSYCTLTCVPTCICIPT
jgi:hypothetical protein